MTEARAVDELAIARSLRRLDEIAARHPDLLGAPATANVAAWIETLTDDAHEGAPMAKAKDLESTQLAIRLPAELMTRIDRHVERMNVDNPGLGATRTLAVRVLVTSALDLIEAAAARRGKKG